MWNRKCIKTLFFVHIFLSSISISRRHQTTSEIDIVAAMAKNKEKCVIISLMVRRSESIKIVFLRRQEKTEIWKLKTRCGKSGRNLWNLSPLHDCIYSFIGGPAAQMESTIFYFWLLFLLPFLWFAYDFFRHRPWYNRRCMHWSGINLLVAAANAILTNAGWWSRAERIDFSNCLDVR